METLGDFLTFRLLISEYALVVFYYLGAVGMPLFALAVLLFLGRRFPQLWWLGRRSGELAKQHLPWRYRFALIFSFLLALLMMELFWRMLFEYLIAFLQIRDALEAMQSLGNPS